MIDLAFLKEPPDICAACGQPTPFLEPGSSRVSVLDEHGWQMYHRDCFNRATAGASPAGGTDG